MPCAYKIPIQLDGRKFVVEYDSDGDPLRIKERKSKPLPALGVYEVSYWVASSHALRAWTRPDRILNAAGLRKPLKDREPDATP